MPAAPSASRERQGLLALDPVGLLERADVERSDPGGEGGRDLAAVGDKTSHQNEPRPHREYFLLVYGRSINGRQHRNLRAGGSAVGSKRPSGVPRRRRDERGHGQLYGPRDRDGHPSRLEGARGIQALGLGGEARDAESLAEPWLRQERRITLTQIHDVTSVPYRQKFCPAPQAARPALCQRCLCQSSGGLLDIVAGEKGASVRWVESDQLVRRIPLPRKRALQMRKRRTGVVQISPSTPVRTGAILLARRTERHPRSSALNERVQRRPPPGSRASPEQGLRHRTWRLCRRGSPCGRRGCGRLRPRWGRRGGSRTGGRRQQLRGRILMWMRRR